MKAIILAGGFGTRISEETHLRPKPMIEIGGMPIIWHIMKLYSFYGISEFIICCGYKGYVLKEYFANYALHRSNVTFDFRQQITELHKDQAEPWRVTLVDTGEQTMTGGRLKRISEYLSDDDDFCMTYGDGLSNVNIESLIAFHKDNSRLATVTAVMPPGRFGSLTQEGGLVKSFEEKPFGESGWINGGFFVLNKKVLNFIEGDGTTFENTPLIELATSGELSAFEHRGFWQPMDTLRDKMKLEELWDSGSPPWKVWDD